MRISPLPVRGLSQLRDTEVGVFDAACRLGAGPGTWTVHKMKKKRHQTRLFYHHEASEAFCHIWKSGTQFSNTRWLLPNTHSWLLQKRHFPCVSTSVDRKTSPSLQLRGDRSVPSGLGCQPCLIFLLFKLKVCRDKNINMHLLFHPHLPVAHIQGDRQFLLLRLVCQNKGSRMYHNVSVYQLETNFCRKNTERQRCPSWLISEGV